MLAYIGLGQQKYKVTINPPSANPNYVGKAKAIIQYTDGLPPKPRYLTYHITYVNSSIRTSPDFVTVPDNDEAFVLPLLNDVSSASGLKLNGIAHVQSGSASLRKDSVFFSLEEDANSGFVLYGVSDSQGATANGMIYFIKRADSPDPMDTLRYTLLNTRNQYIFLPSEEFFPEVQSTKGLLTQQHPMVYNYVPIKGASGTDTFTFTDSQGNSRVVIIQLINKSQNTSTVRNDNFYTPKNTTITFDVFANDLSTNFPISSFSPGLIHDTLGVFSYTPPAGFSGIKNFTYTVNYGYYKATAKISVAIGNYEPQIDYNYSFNTLKNNSVVISYDVPIENYSIRALNIPQFGSIETFNNNGSISEDCNLIVSKSVLIYTPDLNYYGTDSFDVEYCVLNNPCVVYKIYINIYDAEADVLCHCKGRDCVWSGDMNGDGRVSVSDLISLGRFIGLSGEQRNDITYPFRSGQQADNWNYTQPNGVNIKHIDANGDGLLSVADTTAISDYYASIHNFVPNEVLAIKDYPFEIIPNTTELDSGDLLVLDIVIGSNSNPVLDVFGLAFGLSFSPSMIDSASLSGHFYTNGWFANGGPSLQMIKQPKVGIIHAGFTKTSGIVVDEAEGFKPIGTSGNGKIGQISFIVVDEAEGFRAKDDFIIRRLYVNNITLEDAEGEQFLLPETYLDVKINLKKNIPVPSEEKLLIFPNPGRDAINIHFNGRNTIQALKLFDSMGNMINSRNDINAPSHIINTETLPTGMYVLRLVTTEGVISKKIQILRK
jgi:Secretion system C-terminal sorting domain